MNPKTQKAIQELEKFVSTPLAETLEQHQKTTPQEIAINLFKTVAATVPAYKAFLATHHINPATIQTLADFQKLPVICKENYISLYTLPELCQDRILGSCDMIAASSGSTGKSTFWPRFFTDELQIATRF
ncbi:MAG: phenylacetate--CoA ligase family protein, partial [Sphaerospermopsis kisseleviana]